MTHTPGPWETMKEHMPFKVGDTLLFKAANDLDKVFDGIEILDKAGDEALIIPTDMIQYYDEMASFAVLTLSVHFDMLAALEAWMNWIKGGNLSHEDIIEQTNTAIAKARGRPPKEKG